MISRCQALKRVQLRLRLEVRSFCLHQGSLETFAAFMQKAQILAAAQESRKGEKNRPHHYLKNSARTQWCHAAQRRELAGKSNKFISIFFSSTKHDQNIAESVLETYSPIEEANCCDIHDSTDEVSWKFISRVKCDNLSSTASLSFGGQVCCRVKSYSS